jgi:hypothetical protein
MYSSSVSSDRLHEDFVGNDSRFVTKLLCSFLVHQVFCNVFSGRKRSVSAASDSSEVFVIFLPPLFSLLITRYSQHDLPGVTDQEDEKGRSW